MFLNASNATVFKRSVHLNHLPIVVFSIVDIFYLPRFCDIYATYSTFNDSKDTKNKISVSEISDIMPVQLR